MFRFLLTRRWIIGHVIVLGVATLFLNFGFWQLRRLGEKRAINAVVAVRMAADPVPLDTLWPQALDPTAIEYRRVTVSGTFDPASEVLIRSRSHEGSPGFWVVTPLRGASQSVLVIRGWVPITMDSPPLSQAAPPAGSVTVEGLVRVSQTPWRFGPRDPATGYLTQFGVMNARRIGAQLRYPVDPFFVQLQSPVPTDLPVPVPAPTLSEGSHLSYALQWFSFALIGVVGYGFLIRKQLIENRRAAPDPGLPVSGEVG